MGTSPSVMGRLLSATSKTGPSEISGNSGRGCGSKVAVSIGDSRRARETHAPPSSCADFPTVKRTVLSVFGLSPTRIGGTESHARELSVQLGQHGWSSVLCFEEYPPAPVRQYLSLPNVTLELVRNVHRPAWGPVRDLARLVRRHRPSILHLQYTGVLS